MNGLISIMLYSAVSGFYLDSPIAALVTGWSLVLLVAWVMQIISLARRTRNPHRVHTHSWSIGIPVGVMQRVWTFVFERWSQNPLRMALTGEPAMFLGIALVMGIVEAMAGVLTETEPAGIWLLPMLTGLAVWSQAAIIALRDFRQLSLLSDQETEQVQLSEAMMRRPSVSSERQPEGTAIFASSEEFEKGLS